METVKKKHNNFENIFHVEVQHHLDLKVIRALGSQTKYITRNRMDFKLLRLSRMYISNAIGMHNAPLLKAFVHIFILESVLLSWKQK